MRDFRCFSCGASLPDSDGWYIAKKQFCSRACLELECGRNAKSEDKPCPPAPEKPRFPTDPAVRKGLPVTTGVLDYFPDALLAVSAVSKAGNDQHNPGQALHWSRGKSNDQADTLVRHLMERGSIDTDGHRHSAKMVWRALALLQLEIEEAEGLPPSRGSK